jgi:hypothetical protein
LRASATYALIMLRVTRIDSPKPMIGSADTAHGDSESEGRNLGAIQEVGAEEANRDEKVEQEYK